MKFPHFYFQKRIVSAETICGNTVVDHKANTHITYVNILEARIGDCVRLLFFKNCFHPTVKFIWVPVFFRHISSIHPKLFQHPQLENTNKSPELSDIPRPTGSSCTNIHN